MTNKEKIKISVKPEELSINELQKLSRELKVKNWQDATRLELVEQINEIAIYDKNKARIDRVLNSTPTLWRPIGQIWLDLFYKSKWITSIISVIAISSIFILDTYSTINSSFIKEQTKVENLEINQQLNNLNEVEGNIKTLLEFVKIQKSSLTQTEKQIQELTKEKNELEPIVNTNREVIEAILKQQNSYNQRSVWIDRLIGFGLGILGSIIASILFNVFANRKTKKNEIADERDKQTKEETIDNK